MNVAQPSKIVCVGRNYAAHARELGNDVPKEPLLFFKPPSSIIAPGEAIVLPGVSHQVEYESEIGVVIGRRASRVDAAHAMEHVRGFTCANDVTCRDLQKTDGQWARAKGFDTFCPVGPRVAEGLDWAALEVIGRVNGEQRQHGRSADMIFPIPVLIEYISHIMTLEPGDLILTGTPEGVGPLAPGDVVEVEVPGVGVLRNPVNGVSGVMITISRSRRAIAGLSLGEDSGNQAAPHRRRGRRHRPRRRRFRRAAAGGDRRGAAPGAERDGDAQVRLPAGASGVPRGGGALGRAPVRPAGLTRTPRCCR